MAGSLIHGSGTIHFLDEIEVTCALNAGEVMIDRSVVDARTFCGNEQVPGERVPGATFGGFGYWGADEYEDALTARMQSGADVDRLSIFGTTPGSRTYEVLGPLTKESHAWKATEILGLSGEIAKGETLTRGVALEINSSISATGAQTGQQHEATTADQVFVAVFRVKSVSGAGSVTFGIDESQDDGGGDAYSAIAGISAVFTAPGIQRLTATSATELWKRLNVTAFSGFTSVVATVTVGVQMPD